MYASRRVVVTGLSAITPIGHSNNISTTFNNLLSGKCGVTSLKNFTENKKHLYPEIEDRFEQTGAQSVAPCKIQEKELFELIPNFKKHRGYSNRTSQMALLAANYALNDSKLELQKIDKTRVGVSVGSCLLGFIDIVETEQKMQKTRRFRQNISPYFIPRILNNTPAGAISMEYNFKGPNTSHTEACATGNHSIGDGFMQIKYNRADCMIVGASDSCLDPTVLGGFARIRALSKNSENNASRPFDKNRDGFVMGEGAGILVLEDLEHAKNRNAEIYAEITGYGATADAHHITAPSDEGEAAFNAMKLALRESEIDKVDLVNAHATSTPLGDDIEVSAVKRIFGKDLPYLTSNKGAIGHLLAAAGAVEGIFTVLSVKNDVIPCNLNLENPSSDYDKFVMGECLKTEVNSAISNSFGFGGNNSSVVFKKYVE